MEEPEPKFTTSNTLSNSLYRLLLFDPRCILPVSEALILHNSVPQRISASIWTHTIYFLSLGVISPTSTSGFNFFFLYTDSLYNSHFLSSSSCKSESTLKLLMKLRISRGRGSFPSINTIWPEGNEWRMCSQIPHGRLHSGGDVNWLQLMTVTLVLLSPRRLWPSWESSSWLFWRNRFQLRIYHYLSLWRQVSVCSLSNARSCPWLVALF